MRLCFLLACLLYFAFSSCAVEREVAVMDDFEGTDAATFGFLPDNPPSENVRALQEGLDTYKTIRVSKPGIYDLDSVVLVGDDVKMVFGEGVYIRKQRHANGRGAEFVFANRGAYTRTCNENIEIIGLNLICNGLDDNGLRIPGATGQLFFFHVKNLTIKDFQCMDVTENRFCIQIAEFENLHIENLHIEGLKDGIHLGAGKNFVIRNGVFRTYDDPIALNAHDYDVSNPTVGWIENGLIEACRDLSGPNPTGYFCRILGGAWVDWHPGMRLQKSDIVVNNGRLYRVIASPDGRKYVSHTAPTHADGIQVLDGISWHMMQDNVIYNAGCRNIHFKDIRVEKDRHSAFSIHFDMDDWSRSYYPGATAPVQENLTFENVAIVGNVENLLMSRTPMDNIRFVGLDWTDGDIQLKTVDDLEYEPASIVLDGSTFFRVGDCRIVADENRAADLRVVNTRVANPLFKLLLKGDIRVEESDVPYEYLE